MIPFRQRADELLEQYKQVIGARPKHNAVDIQILKDSCTKWANHLSQQCNWGNEHDIAEACYQLEPKLKQLQEQVIIEILKHGTI